MSQVTAIITKIVMDGNYHVSFYDQYGYVVQTLQTDTYVEVVGSYLVCGSNGDSIKFYANTVELIEGPTFSETYTPISDGFYQQGSQYFERLSAMYDYIKTNIVNVVVRDISALKFKDGTTQTTAATGGGGSGTVTSVGFTAGTGITVGGTNPITTSGSVTITNSAPDQVVTMTDGAGIDVTGTYPNFTVTNTAPDQTVVLTDGTGIDVTGTYPSFTITNTAPDQTVSLTEGTGIDVTGTYPNFTVANTAPDQTVTLTEGTGIDITGTYPNFTIASTITGGITKATTAGTDTYTTTISGVSSYTDGDTYLIRFTTGNTAQCTLNINSLGAKDLYRNNDGLLIGGDIVDGAEMLCVYNSSLNGFQLIGTSPNTLLAYVTNDDSVTITKGQPVYAFGGQGDRLTVKRAYNTGDSTSAQTVGLVFSASISVNGKGLIILNGQLDGLDSLKPSAGWADGDPVYLGATAGSITNVKPHAPNHLVYLGFVTTANNGSSGRMYVRVQNGYEMDEIHDVSAQNPNNNDGLFYNTTTSLWEHKSIATVLGYTPGQGTVTSIATTSPITGGTITTSGTIGIDQADATKGGYVSATDWNKFNDKQDPITLTTTGTSGAATLVGSTLNIPQYSGGSGVSKMILGGSGATTALVSGTNYFLAIVGIFIATGSDTTVRTYLREAGTLKSASLFFSTSFTGSLVCTLMVSGVASAMTFTIAGGSAAGVYPPIGSSPLTAVSIASTDYVSLRMVQSGGAGGTIRSSAFTFEI